MCGRKTLTKGKLEIIEQLSVDSWDDSFDYTPSYNIAPTNIVPILIYDNFRIVKPMVWGLIPSWSRDEKNVSILINARSETLTEKPSFSNLVYKNRCIIITDGYYEWKREGSRKQPYYIHKPDSSLMPMAGLWSIWKSQTGKKIYSYTVITTEASSELSYIHNRMPVIIPKINLNIWLNCEQYNYIDARQLLKPYPDHLDAYKVSTYVNSVNNDSPKCIEKYNKDNINLF